MLSHPSKDGKAAEIFLQGRDLSLAFGPSIRPMSFDVEDISALEVGLVDTAPQMLETTFFDREMQSQRHPATILDQFKCITNL